MELRSYAFGTTAMYQAPAHLALEVRSATTIVSGHGLKGSKIYVAITRGTY